MGSQHLLKVRRELGSFPFFSAEVSADTIDNLLQDPEVEYVRKIGVTKRSLTESLQHVNINVPRNTSSGYSGAGQTIAIIDDGGRTQETAVSAAIVHQACFADFGDCPNGQSTQIGGNAAYCGSTSNCQHGIKVANVAVGRAWTDVYDDPQPAGVAPQAQAVLINVFGGTPTADDDDIIAALEHTLTKVNELNISAVNMSLGKVQSVSGSCDSNEPDYFYAVDQLVAAGVTVIAAAGNDGRDFNDVPACFSNTISVGALNENMDGIASYSNRAADMDIMAPGTDITVTSYLAIPTEVDGTSFSAPHVAGAVLLLRELHPGLPPRHIKELLLQGSTMDVNGYQIPTLNFTDSFLPNYDTLYTINLSYDAWGANSSALIVGGTTSYSDGSQVSPASLFYSDQPDWFWDFDSVDFKGVTYSYQVDSISDDDFQCSPAGGEIDADKKVSVTCYPPDEATNAANASALLF